MHKTQVEWTYTTKYKAGGIWFIVFFASGVLLSGFLFSLNQMCLFLNN